MAYITSGTHLQYSYNCNTLMYQNIRCILHKVNAAANVIFIHISTVITYITYIIK
jgi:pyrrolidone-carboxylate peptidase